MTRAESVVRFLNIEYNRCKEVVAKLNNHFKDKEGLANVEFPKKIDYGTNEYYLYMFYSCLLDYGMRSKVYHKNLINTYEKYSNIFNPSYVDKMSIDELHNIIVNNIHPRYPNVATKKWVTLSNELSKYDSIETQLKNIRSFEDLNKFIKSIKGYGQKTGGLLMRILCDSKVCDFQESIKSIPIDRHDIEVSYLTSIIDETNISNNEIIELSNTYVNAGKELDINPSNIDKYLWEIGNSYCNKKQCEECPLNSICIKTK